MVIKKQKSPAPKQLSKKSVGSKSTQKNTTKKSQKIDALAKGKKRLFTPKKELFSQAVLEEVSNSIRKPSITSFPFRSSGIIFFSVMLVILKAILLRQYGFVDVGSKWEVIKWYISWLGNDILYCLVVWFVAQFAMRFSFKPLKAICVFIMCVLLYLYWADIFALTNFHSRFILSGLAFFSWENAGPYIWYGLGATVLWLLGVYASVWIVYIFVKYVNKRLTLHILRIGVACVIALLGLSFLFPQTSPYQQNILQLEFPGKSRATLKNDKTYESYFKNFQGKDKKPNIIVVFAESFSSIDSKYAGGSKNLLSGFDTIARDGAFYTNFIANGCTSDSAHIALLQGVEPWESTTSQQEYTRYKSYTLGLPAYLNQQGYKSTFVSTVTLDFLHQKDFLTALQFDDILGSENFPTWQKYVFRAAPDEALYKETEKVLLTKNDKPQFIVLQTISSHKPYSSPAGDDEESAFRYSDDQLLAFYRELQSMHYFDNGILVVVGDHRKMQAMGYNEIERRGKSAYGKALLTVVGKDIPKGTVIKTPVQHWDIFSSLKRLASTGPVNLHSFYNDIFGGYQGRDSAIRYCQFVDRQYVASRADGSSWIITPSQHNDYAAYIRSYYEFQQGKKYDEIVKTVTTGDSADAYPGLIRIAHQGYTVESPPDSLDAYKAAKVQGAQGIEMDISFTHDGFPIVMHGPDLGRTKCTKAEGKKLVSDFDLQDMKDNCQLYNGQVILTLQEMLEKTQGMFDWYFVDVKVNFPDQKRFIGPMLKTIQKLGLADKIMFSSTDPDTNYQLGSARDIIAGREVFSTGDLDQVLNSDHSFVLLPTFIATPESIDSILDAHKIPIVYTVNSGAMLRQMYDRGVRYFLTDKPAEVVK